MKARQLVIVLVVLLALGGVALVLYSRNASSWRQSATVTEGKMLNFSLNDVAHLTIKGSGAELNLVKKADIWTVAERFDYPADFNQVSGLVRKLWELRPAQDVKVGPSQLGRLELVEPGKDSGNSMLFDVKGQDGKPLARLLVGKKQMRESEQSAVGMAAAGRYAMPMDGSNRVFLLSETFDSIQIKPERWLNRDFIKVENPKLVAVAGTAPDMRWTLSRDTTSTAWKLADAKPGEELDAAKASGAASLFANASFTDVLDQKTPPAETGLDNPSTLRIETFDGFVYELRIGKAMAENYPVRVIVNAQLAEQRVPGQDEKPEDTASLDQQFQTKQKELMDKLAREKKLEAWSYLIPKGTIDQLLKSRSNLFVEKQPSPSPAAPDGKSPAPPIAAPGKPAATATSPSPSPRKRPK